MLPHWKPGCQKPHGVGCQNCMPLLQESGVIRLLSWLRSLTTGIRGKSKARSIALSCSRGKHMVGQASRRCVSESCVAAKEASQGRHNPDSSKVRGNSFLLHLL